MRLSALARTGSALLAAAVLVPSPASPQGVTQAGAKVSAPTREPGDKTGGEEEEIREREEWFQLSRGMADVARPDLLRAGAVQDLARAQARRSEELKALGQSWQPIGPYSMTMLNWSMGRVAGRAI